MTENIYAIAARVVKTLTRAGMKRSEASAKVSAAMNACGSYEEAVKALRALTV